MILLLCTLKSSKQLLTQLDEFIISFSVLTVTVHHDSV